MQDKTTGSGCFIFNGEQKDKMSPTAFGRWAVTWSVKGIGNEIEGLCEVGSGATGDTLQHRISSAPSVAQWHLIAHKLAAYHVYCASLPNVTVETYTEVLASYEASLTSLNVGGSKLGERMAATLMNLVKEYAREIYEEFNGSLLDTEALRPDSGATAALVFNNLIASYDKQKTLAILPTDEVLIQLYVAASRVGLMSALRDEAKLAFSP